MDIKLLMDERGPDGVRYRGWVVEQDGAVFAVRRDEDGTGAELGVAVYNATTNRHLKETGAAARRLVDKCMDEAPLELWGRAVVGAGRMPVAPELVDMVGQLMLAADWAWPGDESHAEHLEAVLCALTPYQRAWMEHEVRGSKVRREDDRRMIALTAVSALDREMRQLEQRMERVRKLRGVWRERAEDEEVRPYEIAEWTGRTQSSVQRW